MRILDKKLASIQAGKYTPDILFQSQRSGSFTKEELQARYRELHRRVHPDTGGSTAFAQQLNAAYDILRKRRRR